MAYYKSSTTEVGIFAATIHISETILSKDRILTGNWSLYEYEYGEENIRLPLVQYD